MTVSRCTLCAEGGVSIVYPDFEAGFFLVVLNGHHHHDHHHHHEQQSYHDA